MNLKKLNITTGEVVIKKHELDDRFMLPNHSIDVWYGSEFPPLTEKEAEANANLIADAFTVAIEYGYTPTMLLEERQDLINRIKKMEQDLAKALQSKSTIFEIMRDRKEADKLLAKSKKLHEKTNQDPLTEKQNEKSVYFTQIKKIGEFIEKSK